MAISVSAANAAILYNDGAPNGTYNAWGRWMNAPWEIARELQKPPPAGALKIVRRDAKEDVGLS